MEKNVTVKYGEQRNLALGQVLLENKLVCLLAEAKTNGLDFYLALKNAEDREIVKKWGMGRN